MGSGSERDTRDRKIDELEKEIERLRRENAELRSNTTEDGKADGVTSLTQFCFERVSLSIFRNDADGKLVDANRDACLGLGYSHDELCNLHVFDIDPHVTRETWKDLWNEMGDKGNVTYETVHRRKDGATFPVEVTVNHMEFEGSEFGISFARDMTEQKAANESLRLARFCIEKASVGIYRIDRDHRIIDVNETACRDLGYTHGELIGKSIRDIDPAITVEDLDHLWDRLRASGANTIESVHRRKDGATFPVEVTANHMEFEGSEFSISFVKDITERKTAEKENKELQRQLMQAQKMEAVGQLAGGIAHDFNNLLQVIVGNSQMLLFGAEAGSPKHDRLKQIEGASLRASDLTRRLLTYSRKIESDLRPINLNNEVKQIVAILERTLSKMVSIDVRLKDTLWDINGDALQIEQALMNLAVNAQHAMPEGGILTIETRNASLDREYCKTHLGAREGEYVILSVSDNGIGMDRETIDHIYEPFFTTKRVGEGSGLGLSMVYGIVKSHGGYISCYSEPGRGTAFKIYFPAHGFETERNTPGRLPEEFHGGKETILIVDDDRAVLQLAEDAISGFGYKILTAGCGEEALSLYEAKIGEIDLLVLDLDMPGMGGARCLEELVKINPGVKVVVTSGLSPSSSVRNILQSGTGAFVGKPFQISEIAKKIRDVLDLK